MELQKLILFLAALNISRSFCSVLINKAAFFANSVFKTGVTTVVWCYNEPDEETNFIKQFKGNILVVSMQENESSDNIISELNKDKSFTQTVFFGSNVHQVEYFVSILYQDLVNPIRLIVVMKKPASCTELSELMKVAWTNDVANILVLSSIDGNVTLTTYFPFSNGKCGDTTPVHLDPNTKELFPKKFLNFHGCEIRTSLIHMSPYSRLQFENNTFVSLSGIDGNILHILFDKLNATMKVVSAKDHGRMGSFINGTAAGSYADLVSKKTDIVCPGLLMSIKRYPYVHFSTTHLVATIIWVGPRRREASEFLRVLQPLLSPISPAIFSTSIVFIVVIMTIRRFGFYRYFSTDSVMFQTFVIFLGNNVKFETKSMLTNFMFMLWIWFCTVVRIAYQGDLVHGLQRTIFEPRLGQFESTVKLVEGYGGAPGIKDMYNGTPYYNNFQIIPLKDVAEKLKAVEAGKRFLIATDRQVALDAAPNIQMLDDEPVNGGPVCFYMRPGWPAVTNIDEVILQLIEKGFVDLVSDKHDLEWQRALLSNERAAKPLALGTLIGCFYGLAILYGICTIVLFAEIFYSKIIRSQKKTFNKKNTNCK